MCMHIEFMQYYFYLDLEAEFKYSYFWKGDYLSPYAFRQKHKLQFEAFS